MGSAAGLSSLKWHYSHTTNSQQRAQGSTPLGTPGHTGPAAGRANQPATHLRTPSQSPNAGDRGKEQQGPKPWLGSGWSPVWTLHEADTAASSRGRSARTRVGLHRSLPPWKRARATLTLSKSSLRWISCCNFSCKFLFSSFKTSISSLSSV